MGTAGPGGGTGQEGTGQEGTGQEGTGQEGTGQEQARPAEDAREYVRRMRSLPVDQVIGDVLVSLLNAAQVKLGRRDARLLIDVSTVAHEHARPYLPEELSRQLDQALGQLRLAQVSAEGHAGQHGEPEENDLVRLPAPPSPGTAQLRRARGNPGTVTAADDSAEAWTH